LSNDYVQYLGKIHAAMQEVAAVSKEKADCEAYREAWVLFETTLRSYQREEAAYREKFKHRLEKAVSVADQEYSVMRLSLLKKFFQSRMFVDVTWHSPSMRFLETTAILGTAVAGLLWAVVWIYRPESLQTTNQGALVLAFAVIAYVLRDRIKDRAKHSLHRRLQKILPDSDRHLAADGRDIGNVKEWIRLLKKRQLPDPIRAHRAGASRGEMDRDLPEDVLHVRKHFRILGSREPGWALQENTRLNLERYLKYMDDPMKELAVLHEDGELSRMRSRRVYHFHLVLVLSATSGKTAAHSSRQVYRIVIDKKGIDRLEKVN
jgi:hypothetical protein